MKNAYEPKKSNVISKCFVIAFVDAAFVSIEPTIYLEHPGYLSASDELHEFPNVFEAKKFIQQHVQPGTRVSVAA